MAGSLLEHETVETEEVLAILGDKQWPPNKPVELPDQAAASTPPPEPESRPERPRRLPPNISPEPA